MAPSLVTFLRHQTNRTKITFLFCITRSQQNGAQPGKKGSNSMADNGSNRTTANSSDIHSCPICHDSFHGDHAAFENHVNSHFADEEHLPPPPPPDQAPVLLIHPHKLQDDAVPPEHSELFDIPYVASTIQDTMDDFKIPCEAQNCNMMGMAPHLTRASAS